MSFPDGVGFSTFRGRRSDLDPAFALILGDRLVLEKVARRLLTPPGSWISDPSYGLDVRGFLNACLATDDWGQLEAAVEKAALAEPGVETASASALADGVGGVAVSLRIVSDDGDEWPLVLKISADSVEIILAGAAAAT